MNENGKIKILFVCMGNICRSPTAEGLFRQLLVQHRLQDQVLVDSAGTHAYHVGNPPDPRAQEAARRRGVDLSALRARQVCLEDFAIFDYILAMDEDNLAHLRALCPPAQEHKLSLLLNHAPALGLREVPDPYYGGSTGFERVLDMIEMACMGLLEFLRDRHLQRRTTA